MLFVKLSYFSQLAGQLEALDLYFTLRVYWTLLKCTYLHIHMYIFTHIRTPMYIHSWDVNNAKQTMVEELLLKLWFLLF